MRNIFKPHNSRFSVLNEDLESNKQNNNNSNNNSNNNNNNKNNKKYRSKPDNESETENRYNNFTTSSRRSKFHEHTEKNKVKTPPTITINDINSFPELTKNNTKSDSLENKTQNQSFLDKLKTVKEEKTVDNVEEIIKDGWVSITLQNRKPTYKYGKTTYIHYDIKKLEPHYVMSTLVNLHEKRREDYIQTWGYDDYEKLFLSPNYDYEYFDKLDEQYELEMEKMELEQNELEQEEIY
jgi:hypothetical protein